jgi:polyhydroxyalkanoate synthase
MVSTLATTRMERLLERDAAKGKVYDRQALVRNFALMRPNDLIFNYVSKGWLQGEDPAAFDVLAWNADASNATAAFERDSIKVVARGLAATPGALTALGAPLDLGAVQCDNLIVAGQRDHITTWRPCYMSSQILGGQSEVIVSTTGHIQTFVNPPGQSRYKYWKGPATGPDPDSWMAATPQREGSWWPEWIDWLLARSGGEKRAPAKLGNKKHPVLGDAPGTYVHEV